MTTLKQKVYGLLRISLGWIFLWGFLDKTWGLGWATQRGEAWIDGVSPTAGFLRFGTSGPLVGLYQSMAGSGLVEWLFMLGMLGIGTALVLGVMMRIAGVGGAVLMLLLYTAVMPPENNPVVDEHVIYALLFILFTLVPVGDWWGFGRIWSRLPIVQKYSWLK
jgi:thiosulfate dehydrogenase [quinone] large subunit